MYMKKIKKFLSIIIFVLTIFLLNSCCLFKKSAGVKIQPPNIIAETNYKGKTYYVEVIKNKQRTNATVWFRADKNKVSPGIDFPALNLEFFKTTPEEAKNALCRFASVLDNYGTTVGCFTAAGAAGCALGMTEGSVAIPMCVTMLANVEPALATCVLGIAGEIASSLGQDLSATAASLGVAIKDANPKDAITASILFGCIATEGRIPSVENGHVVGSATPAPHPTPNPTPNPTPTPQPSPSPNNGGRDREGHEHQEPREHQHPEQQHPEHEQQHEQQHEQEHQQEHEQQHEQQNGNEGCHRLCVLKSSEAHITYLTNYLATVIPAGQKEHSLKKFPIVGDTTTAIRLAESILFKIYGSDAIIDESPYQVNLINGYWIINGTVPANKKDTPSFQIIIDANDGKIIDLIRGN